MIYKHWISQEEIDAGYIALQLWLDSIRSSSPWLICEKQNARELFTIEAVGKAGNSNNLIKWDVCTKTRTIIGEMEERIRTDRHTSFLHMQEARLGTYKNYYKRNYRSMDDGWYEVLVLLIHELEHLELWRKSKMITRGYQDGY